MRPRPVLLLPLALGAAVLACQAAPVNLSAADVAAIRAATQRFVENANPRRDSANAALYTENAVLMPPNQPAVSARPAILAWLQAFPAMTDFNLTSDDVDGRGDLAYQRGTYTLAIAAAGRTPAMTDHGKYLAVWRKQADGSWLMSVDTFNSDVPLPTR